MNFYYVVNANNILSGGIIKYWLTLLIIYCIPFSSFSQWYEKSAGLPEIWGYAWAIDAYDSLIATGPYVTTPDHIPDSLYLTTDGGNSWFTRKLPNSLGSNDDIIDISIIGQNNIWFCTQGKKGGKIYRTTDGGFTWELQYFDTTKTGYLNYIKMFDTLNGIAMGNAIDSNSPAIFLKTTNGGVDWISQNSNYLIGDFSFDIWRGVNFINLNQGYFYREKTIYKTTNSGKDWNVILNGEFCPLLKAYDENILLAARTDDDSTGTMFRTLDAGQSWESYQNKSFSWGSDIEFIPENPSKVWYSRGGSLFFSSDTGKTWTNELTLDYISFNDLVFTNEKNGWLLANLPGTGHWSRIFRTTNGGYGGIVSVESENSEVVPKKFSLEQNFPNPFNPTTNISYSVSEFGLVNIKVYDILGKEVATLVNEEKPAGRYVVEFDASDLSSGMYIYTLRANGYSNSKKMLLMK